MWTLQRNSLSKRHSRSMNLGKNDRTDDDILSKMYLFIFKNYSKQSPPQCMHWKRFWIVNCATSIQECRIIRWYPVICSSSGFQLGSSIKTRSNEVHIMDLLSRALSLLVFLGFTFQLATLSFYMNWSEEFVFLNCSSDSSNCKQKLGIPGSILEKKWQKMTWACFIPALYTVT